MKIKAILPYFGGKRTLAPEIVAELGPHRAYWEPFCGSMAVLLAKPPAASETVNDLHGDLTNLAWVLARHDAALTLYERLAKVLYCEPIFHEAKERLAEPFDPGSNILEPGLCPGVLTMGHVDRAYWYMIGSWMGRNGTAGARDTKAGMSIRWTSKGGSSATRFAAAVDSIPDWHERLRRVVILRRDAFEVLSRIEDEAVTAIYLDPPYIKESRSGNGSHGDRYLHEFKASDHETLGKLLGRFIRARVVVSYYDHPMLDELYAGWTKRKLVAYKNLHVQNRRGSGKVEAPEVLLINGPSLVDGRAGQRGGMLF